MHNRISSLGADFSSGLQKEVLGDRREVLLLSRGWFLLWEVFAQGTPTPVSPGAN